MTDAFRHIVKKDEVEIGGFFERMGLESLSVDEKFDYLISTEDAFEETLEALIAGTVSGGTDIASLEAMGFEDITSSQAKDGGGMVWKRLRQLFATIYLGRLDALHDVITDSRKSLTKYEERVWESEKLIKKKRVYLNEEVHRGSLIELVNTFHNGLGITQDINGSISDDTSMVKEVLLDFIPECLNQADKISEHVVKGDRLNSNKYKHPVEMFPKKYINENGPFLRGTGFRVKGGYDGSLSGWAKIVQKGHVEMYESADSKVNAVLRAFGVNEMMSKGYPNDLEFTVKDIEKTIGQFREYIKILKDYEKVISYRKGRVAGLMLRLKTVDSGHDDSAEAMAAIKVCGRAIDKPGVQVLKRSVRVTRNVAYLINRMAKFAK